MSSCLLFHAIYFYFSISNNETRVDQKEHLYAAHLVVKRVVLKLKLAIEGQVIESGID